MEKQILNLKVQKMTSTSCGMELVTDAGEQNIAFCDITELVLHSDMSAKDGATITLYMETTEKCFSVDSGSAAFFELLFDTLCVYLNVNMDAVFSAAASNHKMQVCIYNRANL